MFKVGDKVRVGIGLWVRTITKIDGDIATTTHNNIKRTVTQQIPLKDLRAA